MNLDDDEWLTIVASATPLFDRLNGAVSAAEPHKHSATTDRRFSEWCHSVTGTGDQKLFSQRLRVLGLDNRTCRQHLGSVVLHQDRPLPQWAVRLAEMHRTAAWQDTTSPSFDSTKPFPFEHAFAPFLSYARDLVAQQRHDLSEILSAEAWRSVEHNLLQNLTHIATIAFGKEFRRVQVSFDPAVLFDIPSRHCGTDLYLGFIDAIKRDKFIPVFEKFPVLARLLPQVIRRWCEWVTEFCGRLAKDYPTIVKTFGSEATDVIVNIDSGISDPHDGGRQVVRLVFASGRKVIYKPRGLEMDQAFWKLISWINRHDALLPMKTLAVVNRTSHGWVEHVDHRPCEDEDQARRYYVRAGMLLCLIYSLNGTDCHCDNLIATGEHPVLIDVETLMQPRLRPWEAGKDSADFVANTVISDSVLRTGLLPVWQTSSDGQSFDISALGATGQQETGSSVAHFANTNTDAMAMEYIDEVIGPHQNTVNLGDRLLSVRDYASDLTHGFSEMYRFLVRRRGSVLCESGPLSEFKHCRIRFLLRPTSTYTALLHRLLYPEFLADGADRSIQIEALTRFFLSPHKDTFTRVLWSAYAVEREPLEELDIPYFYTFGDNVSLLARDRTLSAEFFLEPGYKRAQRRIQNLAEEDLHNQREFILATLHARYARLNHVKPKPEVMTSGAASSAQAIGDPQFISAAVNVADELVARAMRGEDGSVNWLTLGMDTRTERLRLEPMGNTLYDGRCGVALFLAALNSIVPSKVHLNTMMSALDGLRTTVADRVYRRYLIRRSGIGGASGLGGFVYTFAKIDELLVRLLHLRNVRKLFPR